MADSTMRPDPGDVAARQKVAQAPVALTVLIRRALASTICTEISRLSKYIGSMIASTGNAGSMMAHTRSAGSMITHTAKYLVLAAPRRMFEVITPWESRDRKHNHRW